MWGMRFGRPVPDRRVGIDEGRIRGPVTGGVKGGRNETLSQGYAPWRLVPGCRETMPVRWRRTLGTGSSEDTVESTRSVKRLFDNPGVLVVCRIRRGSLLFQIKGGVWNSPAPNRRIQGDISTKRWDVGTG